MNMLDGNIINPFYVSLDINSLDEITRSDIYNYYDKVYIMYSSKKNNKNNNYIYNKTLTKEEYNRISSDFSLISCPKRILNNIEHYNNSILLSKDELEDIFKKNIFNNSEILIPLYELNDDNIRKYISKYEEDIKLEDLKDELSLLKHFSANKNRFVKDKILAYISNLDESKYWNNKYNCYLNKTKEFVTRYFKYDNLDNDEGENYNIDDIRYFKYVKDTSKYYPTRLDKLKISKEDVNNIFNILESEGELYSTFNMFLVSKDYCHYVINNDMILDKMSNIIEKYKPIYKYLFGYAWLSLYQEEMINNTNINNKNRYVFDINTASKLPYFPFSNEDIHQSPYIATTISKSSLYTKKNIMSLPVIKNYNGYGIVDLEEFRRRINIFMVGDENINILDGLDWTKFGISGSIMSACLMKRSPLLDNLINDDLSENDNLNNYYDKYYNNSDIDLMCKSDSVFDFMDNVRKLIDILERNSNENVIIDSIKTSAIIVSRKFIEMNLDKIHKFINEEWSIDKIIEEINNNRIKKYFYRIYIQEKIKRKRINKDKYRENWNWLYDRYSTITNIDNVKIHILDYKIIRRNAREDDDSIYYYMSDYDRNIDDVDDLLILKINDGIKYKIVNNKLKHTIEVFRVKDKDFFSIVSKFHLPCVRAYYTGDNVYLLPSCITSYMTMINMNYKYFAGRQNPIEIIEKYRSRGFGTLLNKREIKHMIDYKSRIENNTKINIKNKICGEKAIDDIIYYNNDMNKKYDYIRTNDDLMNYYDEKYNILKRAINILNLKTINNLGHVNNLNMWISQAYYEEIN